MAKIMGSPYKYTSPFKKKADDKQEPKAEPPKP
jgi:hypothetical protein